MENKGNAQQKKTWITPELMMETVEGTEGKSSGNAVEVYTNSINYGPS